MPARNLYHDSVVDALKADGWTVTDDPLTLPVGERNVHIDLGAERAAGAERVGVVLIAVEVQTFIGRSPVADLQQAVGQYVMYQSVLESLDPDRRFFLAIPEEAYDGIVSEPLGQMTLGGATVARVQLGRQEDCAMDKLARYRDIIRNVAAEYAAWKPRGDSVVSEIVHDPVHDHFELKYVGWQGHRRVHSTVFHLDIIDGKIWIQFDGSDRPVADELVRAGIPKEDIVLAEKPADVRPFTGYGVG